MKAFFLTLAGLLVLAEIVPFFWFSKPDGEFASLGRNDRVRRTSLIDGRSADLLGFDDGVVYASERGSEVSITVLTWNAGNSHGLMDAFGHSPEVCLPVSGAKLLAAFPARDLEIEGKNFAVDSWMFSHPLFDKKIHAFKLAHSGHTQISEMALNKELVKARLLLFRQGRVMPSIEIAIGVVHGTNHPDLAWERFQAFAHQAFGAKAQTRETP